MTKKLETLFDLEKKPKKIKEPKEPREIPEGLPSPDSIKDINDSYQAVKQITEGLPQIKELDHLGDKELDALASKAERAYDDLMDLGMNVEVRYSGRIFEVAGTMMKNAIDAKSAKIDKKLKAVELQLKKLKIDKDSSGESDDTIPGQGYIISDRNELLKKLGQKS